MTLALDTTRARHRAANERIAAGYDDTARRHDTMAQAMEQAGRFELAQLHEREAARARKCADEQRARAAARP